MKKIVLGLLLISIVGVGLLGSSSSLRAAIETEGVLKGCTIPSDSPALLTDCNTDCKFDENPKCGVCCFLLTLYNITDWIFVILVGLAGLFVIIGAMNLLMSAGDPSRVASGRNYIMYAAIGLIVGFLAKAVPAIVKLAVG